MVQSLGGVDLRRRCFPHRWIGQILLAIGVLILCAWMPKDPVSAAPAADGPIRTDIFTGWELRRRGRLYSGRLRKGNTNARAFKLL